MKFDTADIFRRAHSIARSIRAESEAYRAAFSFALTIAWREAKKGMYADVFDYFHVDDNAPDYTRLAADFADYFRAEGAEICGRKGFRFADLFPDDSWIRNWAAGLADGFSRGNLIEDLYGEVDEFVQGAIHTELEREFAA